MKEHKMHKNKIKFPAMHGNKIRVFNFLFEDVQLYLKLRFLNKKMSHHNLKLHKCKIFQVIPSKNLSIQGWDKRYRSIFFPKIFLFNFQVSTSTAPVKKSMRLWGLSQHKLTEESAVHFYGNLRSIQFYSASIGQIRAN